VAWLDTVGCLSRGIETDTVVGAVDLRSHLCFPLLRRLENILAARAKYGREVISLMLGVKCDNRESVHGPMKVVLTPNIGLDVLQQ
jgi:hypothetical protein